METELRQWQSEQQQQEQQQLCSCGSQMIVRSYDFSVSELFESYYDCRKRKRNTPAAIKFEQNLEENLMNLYHQLSEETWEPSPATVFAITKPKPREVWAAEFKDRIVHHLIYRAVGPVFEKSFIHDSCACIKGRGTLYAANRVEQHLRKCTQDWTVPAYILKVDVANFFGSIQQGLLFEKISKRVKNDFLLGILKKLVFQDIKQNAIIKGSQEKMSRIPLHKSLFNAPSGVGLPIGNLSSQFFANIYLDSLDQRIKRKCKAKHYVRYVDDICVIHHSPKYLHFVLESIQEELACLGMALAKGKTSIEPVHKGIDFVGHVIKPYRRHWRLKTYRVAIDNIRRLSPEKAVQTCNSYLGLVRSAGNYEQKLHIARASLKRGLAIDSSLNRSFKTCLLNSLM